MKKQLGQFFTSNSDYILQGMEGFLQDKEVIDPFAGNGDLLDWAKKNKCKKVIGFDVDQKLVDNKTVLFNDSLNNPQEYKFILTNPPYLHKNKADIETKEKFFSGKHEIFEDLYQISIFEMLKSEEGIFIVPLNFLSASNSQKIRNLFFEKFEIIKLNIFLERVFADTTYNVVAFYFRKRKEDVEKNPVLATIFPIGKKIDFYLEKKFGWQLGGDFLLKIKSVKNNLGVTRLTESDVIGGGCQAQIALQNIKENQEAFIDEKFKEFLNNNILILRAIDSKNGRKICLEDIRDYGIDGLVGKDSSRNMAHLVFRESLTIAQQRSLMEKFNIILNENREKYFSFFLTNFRDNGRKRISFDLVYKFLNYIYDQENAKQPTLF
ncbi:MAG: hypothetical protein PHY72_00475 [Candidatus Pacebacteria bacterium]|nr:hypothetical protein [Candidatus Paceibacterota bacterium]